MRMLFLAAALPNLAAPSPESRMEQALGHLTREHDVTLLALAHANTVDAERRQQLDAVCSAVEVLPTGRGGRAVARQAVRRALLRERVDVIHVDRPELATYIPASWQGPLVVDARGAAGAPDHPHPIRTPHLPVRLRTTHAARAALYRRASVTLAASERARLTLEQTIGTPWSIHVVPVGIDLARWEPLWKEREPEGLRVLVGGGSADAASAAGTVSFLRTVAPALRARLPEATYDIPARTAPRALRRLAAHTPGVTLRAEDSAELALWRRASIFLAPTNSPATRRQMLHALAGGVPVVTTPPVCDELAITPGQHALVAATPEEFAAAVARLAADPILGRLLALRGRRLVADRYDIPVALTGLSAAYEHILVGASRCVLCS